LGKRIALFHRPSINLPVFDGSNRQGFQKRLWKYEKKKFCIGIGATFFCSAIAIVDDLTELEKACQIIVV